MKHFELVENAFPGKDCSIEFRKFMGRIEITIRVDDFACRSDIDYGFVKQEISDEHIERMILDMIRKIQIEFDRVKENRKAIFRKQ